jgi:hypothetical protein
MRQLTTWWLQAMLVGLLGAIGLCGSPASSEEKTTPPDKIVLADTEVKLTFQIDQERLQLQNLERSGASPLLFADAAGKVAGPGSAIPATTIYCASS